LLTLLPVAAAAVWFGVTPQPPSLDEDTLYRVTSLAGASVLDGVSPQRLVAVYVFLQMLHYGAWIVAIPALRLRQAPWRLGDVPAMRRHAWIVRGLIAVATLGVIALWYGFGLSLQTTWDLYFQFAVIHVIAEFPFLVRKFT
jgi:hypothetical protein